MLSSLTCPQPQAMFVYFLGLSRPFWWWALLEAGGGKIQTEVSELCVVLKFGGCQKSISERCPSCPELPKKVRPEWKHYFQQLLNARFLADVSSVHGDRAASEELNLGLMQGWHFTSEPL